MMPHGPDASAGSRLIAEAKPLGDDAVWCDAGTDRVPVVEGKATGP